MKDDEKQNTEPSENPDPFEGYDAPKAKKESAAGTKPSRRIAYAAAGTAIASVAAIATVYLPAKILPLVLASFCFFLVFVKCGILHGAVCAAATMLLTFFCGGAGTSLVMLAVCFFPYSLLCLLLRRFDYKKPISALIRAASVAAFVNVAFAAVYFIAKYAVLGGMDIIGAVNGLGKLGYLFAALIVSAVAVVTDVLFVMSDKVITPKIK